MHETMRMRYNTICQLLIILFLCVSATQIHPITRSPVSVGYFASNELGQNLGPIDANDIDSYPYFLERVAGEAFGLSISITTFLYENSPSRESIREIREEYGPSGALESRQVWIGGMLQESWRFVENLPINVVRIENGMTYSYFNTFSTDGLVAQEIRIDDISQIERRFIHTGDGSLHGIRETVLDSGEDHFLVLSLSGYANKEVGESNAGRVAYGTFQDFTVIHTFPNGNEVSQSWNADTQSAQTPAAGDAEEDGLLTLREFDKDLSLTTYQYFDAAGRLVRRTLEYKDTPERSEDRSMFYDEKGMKVEENIQTARSQERILYHYDAVDMLREVLRYRDGIIISTTILDDESIVETLYKKGVPYTRTTYELDGMTVKESTLVK